MRIIKTISVLCCFFLIASPVITIVYLQVKTAIVRYEMQKKLEKEQLVTLHLKPSALKWYEQDKELLIGDELFDVRSISITNYGAIVEGLFDAKEKELKRIIEGLAAETRKQHTGKLLSFLQLIYHQQPEMLISKPGIISSARLYSFYSENTAEYHCPVVVPPPRHSLV